MTSFTAVVIKIDLGGKSLIVDRFKADSTKIIVLKVFLNRIYRNFTILR